MSLNGTKFLAHGAGNVKLGKDISVDHSESPALGGWESVGEPQNMRVAFFFPAAFLYLCIAPNAPNKRYKNVRAKTDSKGKYQ